MLSAACKRCPLIYRHKELTWKDIVHTTGSTCTVTMPETVVPYAGTEDKFNGGQKCDVEKGPCACGAWH